MSDIVERLREKPPSLGFEEFDPTFDVRQEAADEISRLCLQLDVAREALEKIGEQDHARSTAEVYRSDGSYSKMDKCDHKRRMYEDCDECTAEFARSAIAKMEEGR